MKNNLQQSIRELSEIYDKESRNTFISVYLNKRENIKLLEQREKACTSCLKGEEKDNFDATMDDIKEFLKTFSGKNIAIFASHKHDFLTAVPLPIEIHTSLVVDTSPYIRPLARIYDEWESFTLVLLNSHYAKIYSISLGEIAHEKKLSSDIMNKHKKGGWSQARFQRLRQGAIHTFFTEVEEALQKIADKRIVLAGPGEAKLQFQDMLSKHLKERIADVIDIDIHDERELLQQSIDHILKLEKQKSSEAVKHLKAEILKDGLATYGLEETLQAVKNGQVELLIIQKDYKIKGCICEHCQLVQPGSSKECPLCGNPTSEADVIEEILEFAERTGATVEFTDDEEIANLGHIGAILRFK